MDNHEQSADGWDDLDSAAARKQIVELVSRAPWEKEARVRAMQDLVHTMQQEVGQGICADVNLLIEYSRKDSLPQARALVKAVSDILMPLHLALRDRSTGQHVRLDVASTPPRNEHESWLIAEPLVRTASARSVRLPRPVPGFDIVPVPTVDLDRTQHMVR